MTRSLDFAIWQALPQTRELSRGDIGRRVGANGGTLSDALARLLRASHLTVRRTGETGCRPHVFYRRAEGSTGPAVPPPAPPPAPKPTVTWPRPPASVWEFAQGVQS
jgi:hypothetical protein